MEYMEQYSVLMSVYKKEHADYLLHAMDSIWNQTIPTDDFILVCDGPLNTDLDNIVLEMEKKHKDILHVIRLKHNSGLGNALNIGMKYCTNKIIARMDSDDISRPDRCEQQLLILHMNPDISICSGTVEEFSEGIHSIDNCRRLPEKQDEIIQFAKSRNPFNHPCVMYKKEAVESVGGYQDFYLLEDYYLWIRMLQKGFKGYNIQNPILWMRAGSEMYKRRSGWKYVKSQKALFDYMKKTGFISYGQYIKNIAVRTASSLLPNTIRKLSYALVLRDKK